MNPCHFGEGFFYDDETAVNCSFLCVSKETNQRKDTKIQCVLPPRFVVTIRAKWADKNQTFCLPVVFIRTQSAFAPLRKEQSIPSFAARRILEASALYFKDDLHYCHPLSHNHLISDICNMISKAKIKLLHSLKQTKYRKLHEAFMAEGNINVCDFLQGPLTVREVYGTAEWIEKHRDLLKQTHAEVVNAAELAKTSALKNPSEVVALVEKPVYELPDVGKIQKYVLALDDLRDPGNLGTIIRTADWFGIHDIICSEETVDAFNPKVVQATMGSLARVRVHYTSLAEYFGNKLADLKVFGATLGGTPIASVSKPGKGILLIGSEAHGISETLYPFIDEQIRIPSTAGSGAESLNAAVATALVCYEFVQKNH